MKIDPKIIIKKYSIYKGNLNAAGQRHGIGILHWAHNKYNFQTIYYGNFKNGMEDGHGVMITIRSGKYYMYQGEWRKGRKHGIGTKRFFSKGGKCTKLIHEYYINGTKT